MSLNLSSYPDLTQTLLKNRRILTPEAAEKFLNPDYARDIYDPFLIMGMERAVLRILAAMEANEHIVVYGDYDCDGIPGSVVLHDFFKKIGYQNFQNYIPHRHNEGYGLNITAVEKLATEGVTLMITVDCAITDVAEVERANELGMDVIITDHHLPQEVLPKAYAILNSKQKGDTYPDNMLCGAGVAWKLACALLSRGREKWNVPVGWEKWLLDMAGLSTIADMVPLQNENRVLAYYGLQVLRKSRRVGLRKLLQKMDMRQESIVEDDVGFMIGPRINAASRMGNPLDAFRLLATEDDAEADTLAEHLAHLNDTRKGLVASMVKDARKHLDARHIESAMRDVIVIGNPAWRPGLAGLVASNLVEAYARTVFVWGRTDDGRIKGSCRSDGTVNVVEMMTAVRKGVFVDVGGHALSGGFSVETDAIHTLEDELVSVYQNVRREKEAEEQMIDATLTLGEANWSTWKVVERFAPFGIGNPKPTFLFENIRVALVRRFGKENVHLELTFENSAIKAIMFFTRLPPPKVTQADYKETPSIPLVSSHSTSVNLRAGFGGQVEKENLPELISGDTIDLVATMELNMFRGKRELRLRIVSLSKKI
ncbi:MAG: Single-stranded-DNA-specific exonuclease recJ [Parcubacteria group bacterium GW2011_GWA1_47_8]|nr:MAG: Single-stranded-DNA-specific exonuclease recJ [Parcubacteria group bacterium GW2011_GWA1_47_8]KKW07639.1 MAG: Single-stranded-DNA-specific exonuclease recJ [Parcubacteria group bacterium GW2011_GWA2_49_16]